MTSQNVGEAAFETKTNPGASLPKLGIGVLYNPSLPEFLHSDLDALDYVAFMPDMFWTDHGVGKSPRYEELESWVEVLDWVTDERPVVAHNIGLSIGSAELFDTEYVGQLARWHQRYPFRWHSDHLSFAKVNVTHGQDHNAGLAMPVPYDEEVLKMITERVEYVQHVVPAVFLLENNVYYVNIPEQEMTEPQFLNRLAGQTGCGLLLDIHNVYTNARNHGFDPLDFLNQVDLARVVEVHIAGGNEIGGMYTDSHAGPCPETVWDLLGHVVMRAPHLCGITFEFHDSYYPLLKTEGIRAQLQQARDIWNRCH